MQCLESFDYLIINEDLEKSKEIILSIAKTLVYRLKAFNFEKNMQRLGKTNPYKTYQLFFKKAIIQRKPTNRLRSKVWADSQAYGIGSLFY